MLRDLGPRSALPLGALRDPERLRVAEVLEAVRPRLRPLLDRPSKLPQPRPSLLTRLTTQS